MIDKDPVAEQIAIETYREMVRYVGKYDSTTRIMLERILAQERRACERHA
jgi:bacterioferritin